MRNTETVLGELENPERFTTARIWHCKYKSLEPLGELVNLKTLVIATIPNTDLEFLSNLKSLSYLSILHLPKITSISALSKLEALEYLSLSTLPSWDSSGKVTIVDSLLPITKLNNLKHIELFGVCTKSRLLTELEECTSLETGKFSKYPEKEIQRFVSVMNITKQNIIEPKYARL